MTDLAERLLACVDLAVPAQTALFRAWQRAALVDRDRAAAIEAEIRRLPLARPSPQTDV